MKRTSSHTPFRRVRLVPPYKGGRVVAGMTVVLALTAMAYLNIFQNGFVIDDQYFIVEKMADPVSQQGVFRPVRSLLYTIYFQIFGTINPAGYHLHSLLVHLAATGLVYLIVGVIATRLSSRADSVISTEAERSGEIAFRKGSLDKLGMTGVGSGRTAFVAALLFGLHPIHTESITYMAASMEMTGIVFMLASFWLYLKGRDGEGRIVMRPYILSILFATLAFFTYEMSLILPLLILWYEFIYTPFRRVQLVPPYKGGMARKIWPYFGILVFYLVTRFLMGVGMARGDYLAYSPYHTFLTMIKMVVKYIWLLIWPINLSHNHTVVVGFEAFMTQYSDQAAILRQSILDPEILLSLMVIVVIIAWAVIYRKKQPIISFGIGWFFISLLPVLYIFPQGTAIAEKYLYLASVGFVLVVASLICNAPQPRHSREGGNLYKWIPASAGMTEGAGMTGDRVRSGVLFLVVLVFLFYGGRTYLRNRDWKSPITLWEHETVIHPKSELAFYSLGVYYGQEGQKEKAVAAYKKALEIKPEFWQAENNLRNLLH